MIKDYGERRTIKYIITGSYSGGTGVKNPRVFFY